jgi:FixJ family two-component response regulator
MKKVEEVVMIIDDDLSMRQAIKTLIETVGLNSQMYGSGQEFLQSPPHLACGGLKPLGLMPPEH